LTVVYAVSQTPSFSQSQRTLSLLAGVLSSVEAEASTRKSRSTVPLAGATVNRATGGALAASAGLPARLTRIRKPDAHANRACRLMAASPPTLVGPGAGSWNATFCRCAGFSRLPSSVVAAGRFPK